MHFYYKSAKKNNYSFTDRLQESGFTMRRIFF